MAFVKGCFRLGFVCLLAVAGCAGPGPGSASQVRVGDEAEGPWWMQATAMTPDGRLTLTDKPWWPRAMALEVGESFTLVSYDDDGTESASEPRMLVRRERFRNRSGEVEAIVWVIDDDEDGSIAYGGDTHADCYVVDYGPNGVVDRIVDYIDNDGNGVADEMDIRYFVDGQLSKAWFGVDLDGDGHMWHLAGYEYSGDFFKSDPYGDNMIFMNKYDPDTASWAPISECPFAFYDTNDNGYSEVAIRVSAVPLAYDPSVDPDYANDPRRYYLGGFTPDMEEMGIVNVRYSFDIDNMTGPEYPLHYDYGFNLVGAIPYPERNTSHFNPNRRPPQVTRVIAHEDLRDLADNYPAHETGFTWHEASDELQFRWEGVFWIWQRRYMENTGGPTQRWNIRREWSSQPADERKLYYSEVDRRIHLFGAEEGWIEIGHFAGLGRIGEIRMADTDGSGYFDRWEVYLGDDPVPVRVTTVRDERARSIPFEDAYLTKFYTQQVLPEAMAANEAILAAMARVHAYEVPDGLATAMASGSDTYRRYAQDVARELHYQALRRHLNSLANRAMVEANMYDLIRLDVQTRRSTVNSESAWQMARLLQELDVAYGQGDYDRACELLGRLETLVELFDTQDG